MENYKHTPHILLRFTIGQTCPEDRGWGVQSPASQGTGKRRMERASKVDTENIEYRGFFSSALHLILISWGVSRHFTGNQTFLGAQRIMECESWRALKVPSTKFLCFRRVHFETQGGKRLVQGQQQISSIDRAGTQFT
jgi:hypothetical protein